MDSTSNNELIYESDEYKRSRVAYVVQCAFRYWVYLITVDTFLSKLLLSVGISDSQIGVISSFTALAWLFQLLSLFITRSKINSKTISTFFDTVSVILFAFMYLIPISPFSQQTKIVLMVVGVLLACVMQTVVTPIYNKWANSFVNVRKLATFTATKEMVSGLTGSAFIAAMSFVIDRYEGLGNLSGGFLFISCSIFFLAVLNLVSYLLIGREKRTEQTAETAKLGNAISCVFHNKAFRRVILLNIIWQIASRVSVGFMGTFKLKELGMTVLASQIINIVATLIRNAVVRPLGKYTDRHAFVGGLRLGFSIAAAAFVCAMFTTKETRFLIVIYTVLYQCAMAAVESNEINIVYDYVSRDYLVQAMTIKNCIVGIVGILASMGAGVILDAIQKNGNQILGIHMYGQQFLAGLSLCITFAAIQYAKKIEKTTKTYR